MPPKSQDARADAQTVRERQIAAAAHARSKKQQAAAAAQQNSNGGGSSLKDLTLVNIDSGSISAPGQGTGVSRHPQRSQDGMDVPVYGIEAEKTC